MKKSYRDLFVWTESVDLAVDVITLIRVLPWREQRALLEQMQRAAVSVPSNIAEGKGRLSDRELRRYLGIACGSLYELDTQLEIASRIALVTPGQLAPLQKKINVIGGGINNLLNRIARQSS